MGKINQTLHAFNRGIISVLGLGRTDVARVALSAQVQTNWLPRLLGSMMLRPGLQYIGSTYLNHTAINIPFIYSRTDTANIEVSDSIIQIRVNDALITRPSVSTVTTNGNFSGNITGWTDQDEAGTTSQWVAGDYMELLGNGLNYAKRAQQVTVSAPDQNIEHALRIVINRGPVLFKLGSTSGGDEYIKEQKLGTGTHSLAFTPTGDFYITVYSNLERATYITSINVEAAGVMTLPTPWVEANLPLIRWDQSADIIYSVCNRIVQRKIERRSTTSWSIVLYQPEDGPVRVQNTSEITIAASGLSGNITLAANKPLFRSDQVGGLYKLISIGQNVSSNISAADSFTDYIEVSGVGTTRNITVSRSGSWVTVGAIVTLQRSFDEGVSWETATTYTTNATVTYNDGLDNQIARYRIGFKTGEYISGTATLALNYSLGSITGYARITAFTSNILVSAEVLKSLGSTTPTPNWAEGEWSDYRGWPTALALAEGRLFQAGQGKIWGSVADAYESYDDEVIGDSGLISRFIGAGAVSIINWMIYLYRIFLGTDTSEKGIKTSSFEEPITPTNFKLVDPSTEGSSYVPAAKIDKKGIFISGSKLFELNYDQSTLDYAATELTKACPEVGLPGLVRVAIQRKPDITIHAIRSDGKAVIMLYDQLENLKCFVLFETDGIFEDVVVFPGESEDKVYYIVERVINGVTVHRQEKLALQTECQGGTLNKQADSFIVYSGSPTNTISGLSHLEGEQVIVWADGIDYSPSSGTPDARVQKTYLVTSGAITLDAGVTVSNAVVGLPYKAQYQSSKLAYASATPLNQPKKANAIGIIGSNMHCKGLRYGPTFDNLDNLPNVIGGKTIAANTVFSEFDEPEFSFGGNWKSDARLCLEAQAPRPCTLLAITLAITTHDKQ